MKTNSQAQAYFHLSADGTFVGNDPVRGPWSADHCHAGPVTGLIARAAETEIGPDKMMTRLTVDLLRPLPLAGLRVAAETTRHTKTLATTRVTVHDLDDTLCATATTMHLVRKDLGDVPNVVTPSAGFDNVVEGPFPIRQMRHDLPGFAHFVDVAYPKDGNQGPGPKTIWMRAPQLLDGEQQSPIQSLCPLADCGNGISWNVPPTEMGFMNTDLSVHIHREPVSDWLASESVSHWQPSGIGMSQSVLYDRQGPIGTALQTLVLFPPT
ncbi:thioesterase family protein [Rhodobacteraceae bacterium B1Z28]|uniref:Thioesterase family protein n=1 Tax=Ruegeria haliotis TaxID=2747601 RepID=A0ABX2PSK0_9RHOB|nr:thioesterase family protein [Ruegeria haliotis]NVO57144.1 thioesterase family protein [Ruegeria haliotis]